MTTTFFFEEFFNIKQAGPSNNYPGHGYYPDYKIHPEQEECFEEKYQDKSVEYV